MKGGGVPSSLCPNPANPSVSPVSGISITSPGVLPGKVEKSVSQVYMYGKQNCI